MNRGRMLHGKKVVVVLPAYRAAKTLERTYLDIPRDVVDDVLLVDDASDDDTVALAVRLGIKTFRHPRNRGYGGNQKTCYAQALKLGADIVVMLHPDYQYEPRLITPMAAGRRLRRDLGPPSASRPPGARPPHEWPCAG
jgi:glycosyltransferase involved in cell wall biosynthesis